MKKKLTALTLVLIMCLSVTVSAAAPIETAVNFTDEDLFINAEVAREIAKLFLQDAIALNDVIWDETTEVIDVVPLYDGSEEMNITSYSVEMSTGYVVVSAFIDVPNIILEWADETAPVYTAFELNDSDKIIHVGALNYYKDCGNESLETIDHNIIERSSVTNKIELQRNDSYISLAEQNALTLRNNSTMFASYITDPISHAEATYGGSYVAHDWYNAWENYATFNRTSDFRVDGSIENHCGPTAVTNLMQMFADRYNISSILNEATDDLFLEIATIGLTNFYYHPDTGTVNTLADNLIEDSFDAYNVSDILIEGRYYATYSSIYSSLRDDSLLYLMVNDNDIYGDHHMIAYAYTRLQSEDDGSYMTYLKLVDGHKASARYISTEMISNDRYWEVNYTN